MILVSFISEDNVLSDEIKICYIFAFCSAFWGPSVYKVSFLCFILFCLFSKSILGAAKWANFLWKSIYIYGHYCILEGAALFMILVLIIFIFVCMKKYM